MNRQRTNRESRRDVDFLSCLRNEESGPPVVNIMEALKTRLEANRPRSPGIKEARHSHTAEGTWQAQEVWPRSNVCRLATFGGLILTGLLLLNYV